MSIFEHKLVPVVVLKNEQDAETQLSALVEGGLPVAEITFRTEYAPEGIMYCVKHFPQITCGAGTVINAEQAQKAIDCGAKFIVSPGFSQQVCNLCAKLNVPYLPGCVTPTEIMQALENGLTTLKFFPANVYGGLSALKALSGPFTQVKFLPTGGVNADNLAEYLAFDKIVAIGGSWMLKGTKDEMITKIKQAVAIAKEFR